MPEGVTTLPADVFHGANYLRTVNLPSTLSTIGNYAFADCNQLRLCVLPNTTTNIGRNAFSGCTSLRYVMVTSPICTVANNAFNNCPKMFLYCKWVSDATLYAIKNGIDFQLLPSDESDYTSYAADMANTTFYTSSEFAVVDSNIPMTLSYSIPDGTFNSISSRKIAITFSQSLELLENSVTLNGTSLTDYDYTNNTLTINVTEASGTLQFYTTPLQASIIAAYAQLTYTQNNSRKADTIGIVYLDVPLLKLNVPSQTSSTSFDVTGVTAASEVVMLSINGTQVGTATAKKDGTFSAKVSIPATPVSGTPYTVTAKLRSDSSVGSSGTVIYQVGAPTLTQFDMYYYGPTLKTLNLLNTDGTRLTNSIYPNHPFKFVVKFDNYESIGKVFVTSTKCGITNKMQAHSTSTPGEFIAEGYFDGTDTSYVPGTINVYYSTILDQEEVTEELEFEDLPDFWKNSNVGIITDEENEFYAEISFDEGGSVDIENKTVTIQELRESLLGEENNSASRVSLMGEDDIEEILVEFVKLINDLGKSYGKKMISNGYDIIVLNDEEENAFKYIYLDSATKTIKSTAIKYGGALGLYSANELYWNGFMWDKGSWSSCLTVSKTLYGEYKAAVHTYDDIIALDDARSAIQLSSLSAAEKQQSLERVDQVEWLALALDAYRVAQPFIGMAVKSAATAAFGPVGAFAAVMLWDVANDLILSTADSYISDYLEYCKAGGQGSFLKWLIDPSGYVYDIDSEQRIMGVTVTACWIPYDEEDTDFWNKPPTASQYGTVWDASEYSQQNPLYTDAEGNYAWEVPEGWWRIKYEKEGYETIWSDWMTVPPIQTDVNIGMTSTEIDDYAVKYVSNTNTSTTVSLKNNTQSTSSLVFIVAAYNKDGKMIAVNTSEKDLASSETINLTVTYAANAGVKTVKAFVVMKETLVPMREAWSRQLAA